MTEKKITGIVCDNYKLEKFKKELMAKGFNNFEVKPYKIMKKFTLIQVKCNEKDIPMIATLCRKVEDYFAALKN